MPTPIEAFASLLAARKQLRDGEQAFTQQVDTLAEAWNDERLQIEAEIRTLEQQAGSMRPPSDGDLRGIVNGLINTGEPIPSGPIFDAILEALVFTFPKTVVAISRARARAGGGNA